MAKRIDQAAGDKKCYEQLEWSAADDVRGREVKLSKYDEVSNPEDNFSVYFMLQPVFGSDSTIWSEVEGF